MRMIPALIGALLITLAVFLFMHSLIQRGKEEGAQLVVYNDVQVVHSQPEQPPPPKQKPDAPPDAQAESEPGMAPLALPAALPPAAPPAALDLPALDLAVGEELALTGAGSGDRWSAPLGGADAVEIAGGGADAQGFIEVVPFDTRRPNVPLVAWQNKINGWVLVAFSVTPQGRTREVRVLDASPRGVFEEAVIAAVEDWTYQISFSGQVKGDVVLTQKVEVLWNNYPHNLPNVD